jgi:hypothetical protein
MKAKTPRQAADDYERKQNKKTREAKRVANQSLRARPPRSERTKRSLRLRVRNGSREYDHLSRR